jgi:hypothetical protein
MIESAGLSIESCRLISLYSTVLIQDPKGQTHQFRPRYQVAVYRPDTHRSVRCPAECQPLHESYKFPSLR